MYNENGRLTITIPNPTHPARDINWLSIYSSFVALLIRIESYEYSDAKIRTEWDRLAVHGVPAINGPKLGVG